jgi:hypothetical protein
MIENRRLAATLNPSGDELILEFIAGDAATTEAIARGVTLERAGDQTPLRLRLTGLRERWQTNLSLLPAIT